MMVFFTPVVLSITLSSMKISPFVPLSELLKPPVTSLLLTTVPQVPVV